MGSDLSKEESIDAYDYERLRKNQNRRQQNQQQNYKQGVQRVHHGNQYQTTQTTVTFGDGPNPLAPSQQQQSQRTATHPTNPSFVAPHQNSPRNNYYKQSNPRGGNQWGNRRKAVNISDEAAFQPPKYEDLFQQTQTQQFQKKQPTMGNFNRGGGAPQSKPAEGSLGDRGPRNINALNDLIRKEFGSVGGSTQNMPNVDMTEKLFSGRNRLYLGNLPADITREEVNKLMSQFGEIVIDYYNHDKHFGFVRLKHREQAENAQRIMDGFVFKGRTLRVRLANRNACFKVRNLSPLVTNELLKKAFSAFGEVERAEIIVEDGIPTGEGYLEFADKRAGDMALTACVESCFILTKSLRPVILEEADPDNGQRGYCERQLHKNDPEYKNEREIGPRFIGEGSSEYACALLWKNLYEQRKCDEEELANRYKIEEDQLLKNAQFGRID